jgi:predicted GH43/DUF377 family glycosyl hydrolase
VGSVRKLELFPAGQPGDADAVRAWRPWVIEEPDGTLHMWYSGSDGTSSRILFAVRPLGGTWDRQGVAIEPGLAGDDDSYGVESPCVVKTPGGYLMVYGGFDGEVTRLLAATSEDADRWVSQGTILQRGLEDARAATDPCLVITGERWWLFYTGDSGLPEGGDATILAAVSETGASWDRVGSVLEPEVGEVAVSHPCVIDVARTFWMFYSSEDADRSSIALATSTDAMSWERRGTVLKPLEHVPGTQSVHSPCVVKLHDRSLRMWYAAISEEDRDLGYRIGSVLLGSPPKLAS